MWKGWMVLKSHFIPRYYFLTDTHRGESQAAFLSTLGLAHCSHPPQPTGPERQVWDLLHLSHEGTKDPRGSLFATVTHELEAIPPRLFSPPSMWGKWDATFSHTFHTGILFPGTGNDPSAHTVGPTTAVAAASRPHFWLSCWGLLC